MVELTEMMQQKRDENFIDLRYNTRVGKCSKDKVKQLQMRKIPTRNKHRHFTIMFAKSSLEDDYNACKTVQLNHFEVKIDAIDIFSDSTPIHLQTSIFFKFFLYNCRLTIILKT